MYRVIFQLKWTVHPLTTVGISPAYNTEGKGIGSIECATEGEVEAKIADFLKNNNMYALENKRGTTSN